MRPLTLVILPFILPSLLSVVCVIVTGHSESSFEGTCAAGGNGGECADADTTSAGDKVQRTTQRKRHSTRGCRLYLSVADDGRGMGLFTARPLPRGAAAGPPDVLVQIPDLDSSAVGIQLLLPYLRDGSETGGQYEGKTNVLTAVPGLGMLARRGNTTISNVLPFRPDVDEADLARTNSPGAGSVSHYHNFTFYARRDVESGEEIILDHGGKGGLLTHRQIKGGDGRTEEQEIEPQRKSVQWLMENGICVDNLRPGRSKGPHVGRGAFATRSMLSGSVVAPVPLIPLFDKDNTLETTRTVKKGKKKVTVKGKHLLLNYCYSHPISSVALFPYAPVVNMINHDSFRPNVQLRWSELTLADSFQSIQKLNSTVASGGILMMEYVALRDIARDEEIFVDYGHEWAAAWERHAQNWEPPPNAQSYSPSYVMDDVVRVLRTQDELKQHPYGDNLFTSCFYQYNATRDIKSNLAIQGSKGETTAINWKFSRKLFEYPNLRPCMVLGRENSPNGSVLYTALIKNRPNLLKEERIPKGEVHIVRGIPRQAFRFSDAAYTTDQHLENAFRHLVGVPDDIWPEGWMDLS